MQHVIYQYPTFHDFVMFVTDGHKKFLTVNELDRLRARYARMKAMADRIDAQGAMRIRRPTLSYLESVRV